MEAANVLLVPLFAGLMVVAAKDRPDAAMWLGAAACSWLLLVGTAAWLLVLAGMDGKAQRAERLVAFCARAEGPAGTNRDYLFRTLEHLADLGIADPAVEDIARRVRLLTG